MSDSGPGAEGRMEETFGSVLRRWREGRRLTQEQLASEAEVSTRHLSCLERGKAQPSREMVLSLARALRLELRDRNVLLTAAGFASTYPTSAFDSLALAPIRRAIDLMLEQQEPFGAVVVDRLGTVLQTNRGAASLLQTFFVWPQSERGMPMNLVRALFAAQGLRPALVNWAEVATFCLDRLDMACAMNPYDEERQSLRREVLGYPGVAALRRAAAPKASHPMVLVRLKNDSAQLCLWTTLTTLGTPLDVTAQELMIESYFPADLETEAWFRAASEVRETRAVAPMT